VFTEVISGICWCLAECSVGVLLLGCHRDPERRAALIGWHQTVFGVSVVAGSGLGVLLLAPGVLPPLLATDTGPYHTLFAISMVMRLPAVWLAWRLLPGLKELPDSLMSEGGLWRLIPGSGLTMTVGRGLMGVFRRDEGE
jgi:MFS family permease